MAGNDNVTHKGKSDIIKSSDTISNRIIHSLTKRANYKSGSMTSEEYAEYKRELKSVKDLKPIKVPKTEYKIIMSALDTDVTEEDRKHAIWIRSIRNYRYMIINYGYNDYKIVGRKPLT